MDSTINVVRGYKEFEAAVKNIEGIFHKIDKLFDIEKYKEELEKIKEEVSRDEALKAKMPSKSLQFDYERQILSDYTKKVYMLTSKIENELLPFYELYLLYNSIDDKVANNNEENINEIVNETQKLVGLLNNLNTHNKEELNRLIIKAYKTIYNVILLEESYDNSDVLEHVLALDLPINIENIGRLLEKDLQSIKKSDYLKDEIKSIKKDGLGYDYLDKGVIRKLSYQKYGKKIERKKEEIVSNFKLDVAKIDDHVISSNNAIATYNTKIRNLNINKTLLISKILSFVLVPVIGFGAGRLLGKGLSNRITEYKTVTRTVNPYNGNILDEFVIYDEKETSYAATIKVFSPWRNSPTGNGYIRDAIAYEYLSSQDNDYNTILNDLENNSREKYRYLESKEQLDESDSISQSELLVIETYQDKNDNRKSVKYIVPLTITGAGLGIVLDVVLYMLGIVSIDKMKKEIERINAEIKYKKLDKQQEMAFLESERERARVLLEDYIDMQERYHIEENPNISSLQEFIKSEKENDIKKIIKKNHARC